MRDNPWTKLYTHFEQIGFIPNESQSPNTFVRLLEPLYDQIKELSENEIQKAKEACDEGERFTLYWTSVHLRLLIEMEEEKREQEANEAGRFFFETQTIKRDYVTIDDERYDVQKLINLLDDLSETDPLTSRLLILQRYQPLIEKYQLANQVSKGSWYAPDDKAEKFQDELELAYYHWWDKKRKSRDDEREFDWRISNE